MSVGQNIRKNRQRLGLSQEELGEKLMVSRQTVSLWEKDQTSPTVDNLMRLKEIFGISVDVLLQGSEKKEGTKNSTSLCTVVGALCDAVGLPAPCYAADKNEALSYYVEKNFNSQKIDRLVLYNVDAVGQWLYEKHPYFLEMADGICDLKLHLASEMPSVTPVNFGSIYSGAKPSVHGITKYERKPITIETLFDVAARAGKKVALIASANCSMGTIFPDRDIDYYLPKNSYEVNAVATKVLLEDRYDIVVIYNGNYDNAQHKFGPESHEALAELKHNSTTFALFASLIRDHWKHHNTLLGWITDHGCHEIDGGLGSHGLDMPEDINVVHMFRAFPKEGKKD